jgi:ABC-type branched-subunit amino acid transport system ATPase component
VAAPKQTAPHKAAAGRRVGDVMFQAAGVTVRYGGVCAVNEASVTVRAGEIVGLIGPNGAGKTSFVDAVTGFTPSTGEVQVDAERLTGKSASQRARQGLARTWQSLELFDELSVGDNVRVGTETGLAAARIAADIFRPSRAWSPRVSAALNLMGIADIAHRRPSELSLGQQKAVGVARALAMQPKVLLLDEPAAGLDTSESLAFANRLRAISETGVACLLIDHDMDLVLNVCDRVYVMDFGAEIASGEPKVVRREPAVIAAYLGTQGNASDDKERRPSALGGIASA